MCSVTWHGRDAKRFLETVTVADLQGLPEMRGTLSVIPTETGGIVDDTMLTSATSRDGGESYVYQVVNAGCADKDLDHFRQQLKHFGGDVSGGEK